MAKELIKADTAIRTAKPKEAAYRITDGAGLYLLVKPDGAKWWRLDYTIEGKRKTLSMGTYPDTTLSAARRKAEEARRLVADGTDPSDKRKATKQRLAKERETERRLAEGIPPENSFEAVAREWFAKYSPSWAANHSNKIMGRLEADVFPWIGGRPISGITAPDLLAVLRRIEERGAIETAHRVKQNAGQIFRYAIATGLAERDPAQDLKGALPPPQKKHLAAIVDARAIGGLLRAIDAYSGSFVTRCALKLAPLVFVRPGELRKAEWADIDLDAAEWRYTVTKTRNSGVADHLVPLPAQAVKTLRELQALTGGRRYVFPSARTYDRPMSDNAVLSALRRMGFAKDEMSGHGFRAMARTVLDEVLGYPPHIIEQQLAHAVKDPLGRAYNRTSHLPQRREMMQAWADYLDTLKADNVVPFNAKAA